MANETTAQSGLRPARRTIVKGAAWAVPAITVASATPAMAASQEVTIVGTGNACKSPGGSCDKAPYFINKGYFISVVVCTDVRAEVSINFGDATVSLNGAPATNNWDVTPNPLVIAYNGETEERCQTVVLAVEGEPNSQNVSIDGSAPFSWTATNGLAGSGTMTFSAPETPPCDACGVI